LILVIAGMGCVLARDRPRAKPGAKPGADISWHAAKVRKAVQQLLADGAIVEDIFNIAVDAARAEWACRIVCRQPLILRIDGYDYQWPAGQSDEESL
jgi:hypothetical protein